MDKRLLKYTLEKSNLHFARYFFKFREGSKFIVGDHHAVIAKTLARVASGEITRLVINIPPGYTKTELAVINFIAHGMTICPNARFLHLSASSTLSLLNSSNSRDLVDSEEYQELWSGGTRKDSRSKQLWHTENGAQMYATSAGGQVTGFRAGRMVPGFSGSIIIDDPVKPDDARSKLKRSIINARFNNTIRSRLALETTPIIVIMQRIDYSDLSGFLLRGGSNENWHHLLLPILVDTSAKYSTAEFPYGIPIEHSLKDGPLWKFKHTLEQLESLKKADPRTFWAQYMQEPLPEEGQIFKEADWGYYNPEAMPVFEEVAIYGDTAFKEEEWNDYSVFQAWGKREGCLYLIDQIRGKWEAPKLRRKLKDFVAKHHKPHATYNRLTKVVIEDKASGTGLIQELRTELPVGILPILPYGDKPTRARDGAPFIESKRVLLPEGAEYVSDYTREFGFFRADMSHDWDDQIDATLYAIQDQLQNSGTIGVW